MGVTQPPNCCNNNTNLSDAKSTFSGAKSTAVIIVLTFMVQKVLVVIIILNHLVQKVLL